MKKSYLFRDNKRSKTVFGVLGSLSFAHLLNDMIQSLILAIYPLLHSEFSLSFVQIGLITLTYQLTASLLQPFIGYYTDKHPLPWSLPVGMGFTLCGLMILALSKTFPQILFAAALVGTGSSIFHPESSRIVRMAAGHRRGLAQSLFQVGGNLGTALGPLLAALFIAPYGKGQVGWFAVAALFAIILLLQISRWYKQHVTVNIKTSSNAIIYPILSTKNIVIAMGILLMLLFSKYFYLASLSSYYTFYLIHKFHLSVQDAQFHLFLFLFAVAVGTLIGGPVGDKIGRKTVILCSILGVAPFSLMLPHVSLLWTSVLSVIIGLILASAFSAILVYAQELMPGRTGMVSGLFFGLAFGLGGIGAALLGIVADHRGIKYVYESCAWLPLIGIMALKLPDYNATTPDPHSIKL